MINLIRDWAKKELVSVYFIQEEENNVKILCYDVHYQDLIKLQRRLKGWHISFISPQDNEAIMIQLLTNK